MLESQLLHTLRLLEQEELETLQLFVASPIFQPKHHGDQAFHLFMHIRNYYPEFQDDNLLKETIAAQLFGKGKNPGFDVTRAMTDLLSITHNFINHRYSALHSGRSGAIEQEGNDQHAPEQILLRIRKQLTLMRFYNERLHERPAAQVRTGPKSTPLPGKKGRNPHRFFENLYQKVMKELGKITDFSAFKEQEFNDYLYFRYLVQQEKSLFDGFINPANSDQNLILAMEELDTFYLFKKLHLLSKFINLEEYYHLSEEMPAAHARMSKNKDFMIQVCQLISREDINVKPIIHLFVALIMFRTQKDQTEADIQAKNFISLLETHQETIPEALLEEFELQVCNHWSKRYQRTRDEKFALLLHSIHLKQVDRLRNNKRGIPASQLTSIVFTALKLGLGEWAEEVLDLLGLRIIDADAELIYPILLAQLLFDQKRFSAASKVLPHFINYGQLKDMAFYVRAAKLDIKICYELNRLLEDEHESMFRATQVRLKRDKSLTRDKREMRERFFPLVMKLYRAKEYLRQSPKANIVKRLQDVQDALNDKDKPVVDADWLQAKLDEFGILKTGNK